MGRTKARLWDGKAPMTKPSVFHPKAFCSRWGQIRRVMGAGRRLKGEMPGETGSRGRRGSGGARTLGGVFLLPVILSWFATSNSWCLEYLKLGGLSVCGRGVFPARQTPMLCPFALLCFSVEDLQGELEKEEKGKKDPCDCEYKAGQVGNLLPARGCPSGLCKWLSLSSHP